MESAPLTKPMNRTVVALCVMWLALAGWVAYIQYDVRQVKTTIVQPESVQNRLSSLEASSIATQEALQINCNGNATFAYMDIRGFTQSRMCLGYNESIVALPTEFAGVTVISNVTEIDVFAFDFYEFSGVRDLPHLTPRFFVSKDFDLFCARYFYYPSPPDDLAWCMALDQTHCGYNSVFAAFISTSGPYFVNINMVLSLSVEACASIAPASTPAPTPEPTPAPTPEPTPEPTPAPAP